MDRDGHITIPPILQSLQGKSGGASNGTNGHQSHIYVPSHTPVYTSTPTPVYTPDPTSLQLHAASLADSLHGSPVLSALASQLVSRLKFAADHGISYGGKRDLYDALGWPKSLAYQQYESLYARGGIAARAVETWPDETWSYGASIIEDPDETTETAFEADVNELFTRLDVWSVFRRADILRAIGEYGIVVIGAPGDVGQPIARLNAPSNVKYLKPYSSNSTDISDADLDLDSESERYGQPLFYSVKLRVGTNRTVSRKFHWTRILHVVDGNLETDLYGKPLLESVYDYFTCLFLIIGGGSEAFWRNVFGGKTFLDLDPDVKFRNTAEEQALADQIEELYHGAKDYIKTRGITPKRIPMSVSHFEGDVETILRLISGTISVPWRRLIGAELGLRSADADEKAFQDKVALRRRRFAEPLIRRFISRLNEFGAISEPDEYEIVWPESEELDETSKASTAASIATANSTQVAAGDTPLMTSAEMRAKYFDLGPIEDTDFNDNDDNDNSDASDDNDTPISQQTAYRALFDTTDSDANEPEWRVVHRVADANRSMLSRYLFESFKGAQQSTPLQQLERDIASGNRFLVEQTVDSAVTAFVTDLESSLFSRLLSIAVDGGQAAVRSARARGSLIRTNIRLNATFNVTFNAQSPRTIEWARLQSAALVREISAQTRAAIRALVSTAFLEGIPPRRLASLLKLSVGLHPRQIAALQNYISTFPDNLTDAQRLSRIERRTNKLLRQRAVTIARTETITAANVGQRELWLQARDNGQLPNDAKRVWILTPDSRNDNCHICPPMDGQIRGLEEQFVTGEGALIIGPTAHPNCRCGVGLATRDDIERANR